ncbi:MAG TPA: IS110 family transposase [Candidatus Limnocylindrales bacterium]
MSGYCGRQIVGIDLHRRRSVLVRMTPEGEVLGKARIDNDPQAFAEQIALMGEAPEVVLEATYGWYWAADLLADHGAAVHLAHPLGVKGFAYRRVKNDERDAADLADLLRMGRLPEAWIAPPPVRELRELVRHRAKLVSLRTGLKCSVHAVLAKCGIAVPMSDLFGAAGERMLARLRLAPAYQARIASLRRLIHACDKEIDLVAKAIGYRVAQIPGWKAVQAIDGVGPTLAAVLVAEIGDVTRFARPDQLCAWAGLTPRHRESDTKVRRGRITKQGNRLVRWACIEAVQRIRGGPLLGARVRLAGTRGSGVAKVACARKLLTLVFYGLRDGEIRCLAEASVRGKA